MAYLLMALLTWAQVAAQQWTLPGLYQRLDENTAGYLQVASTDEQRDALATVQMGRMVDSYLNRLISKCRSDYPDDVQSVETMIMRLHDQANEYSDYADKVSKASEVMPPQSGFLQTAQGWPSNSSAWVPTGQTFGFAGNVYPRVFFANAPVTNQLFAGAAEIGEFLALIGPASDGSDMPMQRIYINRGTKASPNWQAFDSDSLVDYLINPVRIQEVGYERWKFFICVYGVLGSDTYLEWRLDKLPPFLKLMGIELEAAENRAFSILRISLAGTGIASDFDRKTATKRKYLF